MTSDSEFSPRGRLGIRMRSLLEHHSRSRSGNAAHLQKVRRFLKRIDGFHCWRIKNAVNWTRVKTSVTQGQLSAFDRHAAIGLVQRPVQTPDQPALILFCPRSVPTSLLRLRYV